MKRIVMILLLFLASATLYACSDEEENNARNVVSVETHDPMNVDVLTAFDDLNLPVLFTVTLEDGSELELPVAWDGARAIYDAKAPGEYTLEGSLIISGNVTNKDDIKVTQTVNVVSDTFLNTLERFGDFSTLIAALKATNLDVLLDEAEQDYTLFAPTDAAFSRLLDTLDLSLETLLEDERLESILRYHIFANDRSEAVLSAMAPSSPESLSDGEAVRIDTEGRTLRLNNIANVTQSDVVTNNGRIHVIDQVLLPISMIDETADGIIDEELFALILDILAASDIGIPDLLDIGITVFLPDEEAFTALIDTLDMSITELLESESLPLLLSNHMIIGAYDTERLLLEAPITVESLYGETLLITESDGALFVNDNLIGESESIGEFGFVHFIDAVLVPDDLFDEFDE